MKIRKDFLPFSRPSIGETEINGVVACLKSGWITTGALCKAFEDKFCQLTGAKQAVTFNSATAGMHLMLKLLELQPGDEILTPSMTFASTVNMILLHGAKPVFADIEYGTLNVNAACQTCHRQDEADLVERINIIQERTAGLLRSTEDALIDAIDTSGRGLKKTSALPSALTT